ncbi:N-alpha-acetyltransferase 38, NatC auxiliary subunit [Sarcophilus harrisii]|uniref:N-alpha-acetyltransferase 38, NatC auxiliary subunit n=1 Tax=Sarcophilus harrisii TaxID=9305 RepID=A0A7N4PM33_SARHA|nr:N-alpha-acetyltransferase 38, NatC auxiliary subunit [Sarcophilus harrisii]
MNISCLPQPIRSRGGYWDYKSHGIGGKEVPRDFRLRVLSTSGESEEGPQKKSHRRSPMAGAGVTVLLREENGCCSRRQSSSSAGDSDGEREDSAVAARARRRLEGLLNKNMRIRMTDGRTLVGCFLCTDRDCNVILGSAQEFLKPTDSFSAGEPRVLGLAMVPGHHIVSVEVQRESLTSPYL